MRTLLLPVSYRSGRLGCPGIQIAVSVHATIYSAKSSWYINVNTSGIAEETADDAREDKGDIDGDGYLTKKLDYAFRYKVATSTGDAQVDTYKKLDFIFDSSPLKIIRGTDQRGDADRTYKVVLEGYQKELGIRRPQSYYILEKQQGVPDI